MILPESNAHWYAVRTKSRCERVVQNCLAWKGYEVYLPTYVKSHVRSERVRVKEAVLFPGYLFCRFGDKATGLIVTTPGFAGFVQAEGRPAPVSSHELDAVRNMIQSGLPVQPHVAPRAGDPVQVIAGPLRGIRGTLVAMKNNLRLVVAVTLLNRCVSVEIDGSAVVRV